MRSDHSAFWNRTALQQQFSPCLTGLEIGHLRPVAEQFGVAERDDVASGTRFGIVVSCQFDKDATRVIRVPEPCSVIALVGSRPCRTRSSYSQRWWRFRLRRTGEPVDE